MGGIFSSSTAAQSQESKDFDGTFLASLNNLGQRLFNLSRQSATALVRAVACQLHIALPKEFMYRARRPTRSIFVPKVMFAVHSYMRK